MRKFWTTRRKFMGRCLGNRLGDYIANGGGLVISHRACMQLQGRLIADNFCPYKQETEAFTEFSDGRPQLVKNIPDHPLLRNVNSFGDAAGFVYDETPQDNTVVVASTTAGTPLIVAFQNNVAPGKRVVGLGFVPLSSDSERFVQGCDDARLQFWDAATDGARIMGNALKYVFSIPS